ncbi:hypothetical protein N0V82_006279 [Gnomoniopsis sp. IMI 355080]|nr:hypothetical protein N0V82_006279 [Gnomoniopsis sp. IMI 355080]
MKHASSGHIALEAVSWFLLDQTAGQWHICLKGRVEKVLDLITQQRHVEGLPKLERPKLLPGGFWDDRSLERDECGQWGWLYDPDVE